MTVALEVFAAFVLDDPGGKSRGKKRRRERDEEVEELKGLKAKQQEDAVEAKKLKLSATMAAVRYLQGNYIFFARQLYSPCIQALMPTLPRGARNARRKDPPPVPIL